MSKQVTLMTDAIPYQEFAKLIGKSTGAVRRMIDTHQRPEAAKAEGKTETQKERKTPARTGAPESETGHAEESAKSTGSARR